MGIRELGKEATCDFCGAKEALEQREEFPDRWKRYQVKGETRSYIEDIKLLACPSCRHDISEGTSLLKGTFDERMAAKRQSLWRKIFRMKETHPQLPEDGS